jgi:hypothetical protein
MKQKMWLLTSAGFNNAIRMMGKFSSLYHHAKQLCVAAILSLGLLRLVGCTKLEYMQYISPCTYRALGITRHSLRALDIPWCAELSAKYLITE